MDNILIQTNIKMDTIKFDVSVADEKSKEKLGSEIAASIRDKIEESKIIEKEKEKEEEKEIEKEDITEKANQNIVEKEKQKEKEKEKEMEKEKEKEEENSDSINIIDDGILTQQTCSPYFFDNLPHIFNTKSLLIIILFQYLHS